MKNQGNGGGSGGIPMNEAHLAARAPDRSPADPSAKTGQDHFVLREDLRRVLRPDRSIRIMANARFVIRPPGRPAHIVRWRSTTVSLPPANIAWNFDLASDRRRSSARTSDNIAQMITGGKSGTHEIGACPLHGRGLPAKPQCCQGTRSGRLVAVGIFAGSGGLAVSLRYSEERRRSLALLAGYDKRHR